MKNNTSIFLFAGCLLGCAGEEQTPSEESEHTQAADLMSRTAGLWVGDASTSPVGPLPGLTLDFRLADGQVLFGRTDLSADLSLQFALLMETLEGEDKLVYASGADFFGTFRDTRTVLVDHTVTDDLVEFHFCAVEQGCEYVDARWTFADEQQLELRVLVNGEPHLTWAAQRVEAVQLPESLPDTLESQGSSPTEYPQLSMVQAMVTWAEPLSEPADVWIALANGPCDPDGACPFSRVTSVPAEAGATQAELQLPQIHPGEYFALAILDRNQDVLTTGGPGAGDGVSLPNQPLNIAPNDTERAMLEIVVDL